MYKLIAIAVALMVCLSLVVPAFAVSTQVEVTSDGVSPIIKCKWETPDDADPTHMDPGTQTLPVSGSFDPSTGEQTIGCKDVYYWAVATHPLGMGAISGVYADVSHPDVQKQSNITGEWVDPEWCGSFKYQVELLQWQPTNNANQVAAFQQALEQGLVTFNDDYWAANCYDCDGDGIVDADDFICDIIDQINQGEAELYRGKEQLCNHQPAGIYTVEYKAAAGSALSDVVMNTMEFTELSSFLIDFTSVNYGQVAVGVHKWAGGDSYLNTPEKPTVWNNGNTYLSLQVEQDDAGFGQRTVGGLQKWNVHWDARLGPERPDGIVNYDPFEPPATIPGVLVMCTPTKLDFSILVDKAPDGAGTYSGMMTLTSTTLPFMPCAD